MNRSSVIPNLSCTKSSHTNYYRHSFHHSPVHSYISLFITFECFFGIVVFVFLWVCVWICLWLCVLFMLAQRYTWMCLWIHCLLYWCHHLQMYECCFTVHELLRRKFINKYLSLCEGCFLHVSDIHAPPTTHPPLVGRSWIAMAMLSLFSSCEPSTFCCLFAVVIVLNLP